MARRVRKWIKGAIKRPGALRRKAKARGMSIGAFCQKVSANKKRYSTRTKRQCALARTLRRMRSK